MKLPITKEDCQKVGGRGDRQWLLSCYAVKTQTAIPLQLGGWRWVFWDLWFSPEWLGQTYFGRVDRSIKIQNCPAEIYMVARNGGNNTLRTCPQASIFVPFFFFVVHFFCSPHHVLYDALSKGRLFCCQFSYTHKVEQTWIVSSPDFFPSPVHGSG